MDSVRAGLRAGDLARDTYDRLKCTTCNAELSTHNDPNELGQTRICPQCEGEWRQIG